VKVAPVRRGAIVGTHVDVRAPDRDRERRLPEILRIVRRARLSAAVTRRAVLVFERLARAEGRVHGVEPADIHFHEVGGYDCIVDVVGSVLGFEMLGVQRVTASAVNLGQGRVRFSHGEFAVPAPAVAELLKGVPVYQPDEETGELTTPTGAAILTGLTAGYGPLPLMRVERVGIGAGTRRESAGSNVLRLFLGETTDPMRTEESSTVAVVEANIDDMNPELFGHVMDVLLRTGALDVFFVPVQMKKNRPGVLLTVIAPEAAVSDVCRVVLSETTSLGVRYRVMYRTCLGREVAMIRTRFGRIRVKLGRLDGRIVTRAPEYEDCRRAALKCRVPLKQVYEEASRRATETGR
jgi:hypothetical protein